MGVTTYVWPPISVSSTNPANGSPNAPVPSVATLVAGEDGSGNLQNVAVDTDGQLQVDVVSSALPTGAATSAKQDDQTLELQDINAALAGPLTVVGPLTDAELRATPVPVSGPLTDVELRATPVTISGTVSTGGLTDTELRATAVSVSVSNFPATQPVSAASLPLPTGASTEATLSALNAKVTAVNTGAVVVSSSALPTGAATETTLAALNTKTPSLGQAVMASSVPVVLASNQSALPIVLGGRSAVNRARNDYTSVNVTTAAYVQLLASTSAAVTKISIFDSSGQTLVLATGAASSEVDQILIFPGGNGDVELSIASGTRISIKAVSGTANAGEISINFLS